MRAPSVLRRDNDEYKYGFVVFTKKVDSGSDWNSIAGRGVVGVPAGEAVHQSKGE